MKTIEELRNVLSADAAENAHGFGEAIRSAMCFLDLEINDVAREFDASRHTVDRWLNGMTVPGVYARRAMFARLLSMANIASQVK